MADTLETIEQVRSTAIGLAMKIGPKVLAALLILALGYFIGRWTSRWLERAPWPRRDGVLGSLFAGLTIVLTKPFRIGEYIEIVSEEGAVESISLFQTTLTHPDRSRVVIPPEDRG